MIIVNFWVLYNEHLWSSIVNSGVLYSEHMCPLYSEHRCPQYWTPLSSIADTNVLNSEHLCVCFKFPYPHKGPRLFFLAQNMAYTINVLQTYTLSSSVSIWMLLIRRQAATFSLRKFNYKPVWTWYTIMLITLNNEDNVKILMCTCIGQWQIFTLSNGTLQYLITAAGGDSLLLQIGWNWHASPNRSRHQPS